MLVNVDKYSTEKEALKYFGKPLKGDLLLQDKDGNFTVVAKQVKCCHYESNWKVVKIY